MMVRFSEKMTDVLLVAGIVAIAAITVQVNARLEAVATTPHRRAGEVGVLPDGKMVRILSLGFDRLVADLYWIRAIHYVGDEETAAAGYPEVNRLADLVTDIDPKFATAYATLSGAIGALKGDPDGAIALLEKGVANCDYWKLNLLLGFSYFIERLDYARAAEQMELAASKGGPAYLPLLAARLYARAGDPETALAFIQARLREEQDPATRKALEQRYWDLWITRDLRRIDAAIDAYLQKHPQAPRSTAELVGAGLLDVEPRDPRGGRYRIEAGRAATDLHYVRLELHVPYAPSAPGHPAPAQRKADGR